MKVNPLEAVTRYEAMALTLHEANPGHHLEAVTRKSLPGLPNFMKYPKKDRFVSSIKSIIVSSLKD